jgi:hypothetical protein
LVPALTETFEVTVPHVFAVGLEEIVSMYESVE